VIEAEVAAAGAILRRHGIPYVVIGGQAISRAAATTTRDVDVMVATGDFQRTVKALRGEADLAFDWETRETARFRMLPLGGVPLDVINGASFAGNRSGEEFFRYLADEGSNQIEGIAFATPAAVWYTRLLTKRWKAYAEKIVTNVIDGVAPERLDDAEGIARRFGTSAVLAERVAYVRGELTRSEVESLRRRS
jgi:hypothetical protein